MIALKKKIIVIKNSIVISVLLIAIIFFVCSCIYKENINKRVTMSSINIENSQKVIVNEEKKLDKFIPKKIFQDNI